MGELADVLADVGFEDVQVLRTFDPFEGTSKEKTAHRYQVQGVNVLARKP